MHLLGHQSHHPLDVALGENAFPNQADNIPSNRLELTLGVSQAPLPRFSRESARRSRGAGPPLGFWSVRALPQVLHMT